MQLYIADANGILRKVKALYIGDANNIPQPVKALYTNNTDHDIDPGTITPWTPDTPSGGIDVTDYTYTLDSPEAGIVTLETYTGSATDIVTPHKEN